MLGPRPFADDDAAELSEVEDKVLFLSRPFRVIASKSSKNFLDEGSVNPVLSERTSYSLVQLMMHEPSNSLKLDANSCWKG